MEGCRDATFAPETRLQVPGSEDEGEGLKWNSVEEQPCKKKLIVLLISSQTFGTRI